MKLSVFSALILLSFAGLALFGFMAMAHEGHGHMGCIGAFSQGADCPQGKEFDFAVFHLIAYKNFSLSVLSGSFAMQIFFLALLLFAALAAFSASLSPPAFILRPAAVLSGSDPYKNEILAWLSIHEQSPNLYSVARN